MTNIQAKKQTKNFILILLQQFYLNKLLHR